MSASFCQKIYLLENKYFAEILIHQGKENAILYHKEKKRIISVSLLVTFTHFLFLPLTLKEKLEYSKHITTELQTQVCIQYA